MAAKLRKKLVKNNGFGKINAIKPKIKAARRQKETLATAGTQEYRGRMRKYENEDIAKQRGLVKLKTVMEACGIEKQISFHCGRHSFATLALSKGMPIESVSRVLGHTNIVTTQIYAKITIQKLNNDLTMLGDKLNASFKNIK